MANQESLSYGVIVTRLENGDWWHGHIVRSDWECDCGLLGRRTNLLFLMSKFGCGGSRKSADFYLTFGGEGVPPELCAQYGSKGIGASQRMMRS
jgi:hypothetical protein